MVNSTIISMVMFQVPRIVLKMADGVATVVAGLSNGLAVELSKLIMCMATVAGLQPAPTGESRFPLSRPHGCDVMAFNGCLLRAAPLMSSTWFVELSPTQYYWGFLLAVVLIVAAFKCRPRVYTEAGALRRGWKTAPNRAKWAGEISFGLLIFKFFIL